MNNIFKSHSEVTESDFTQLWEKGLFVVDTNILLDLYRLPENAKKDLLNILSDKKINSRLWLPFQAALEFNHNTLDAISDQKNKFNNVKTILNDTIIDINNVYANISDKLDKLQLKKRHSAIDPDPFINENLFKQSIDSIKKFLTELEGLDKQQPDVNDKDDLKIKISKLFESKIGSGFQKDKLEEIYKEGEIRYKDNIPPGYKDRDKKGFYLFEDKKFIRKFGDLIVWKEIIEKVNTDQLEYIVLITGDTKEDWWQEKRGKKLGARYELLNEIYFNCNSLKLFHMYDTSGFMQYSKKYLKINIKDQSIKETKDFIEYNNEREQLTTADNGIFSVKNLIRQVSTQLPIKIRFSAGFDEAYLMNIPLEIMHFILMEIFSNVLNHSSDKIVTVRIKEDDDYVMLKFKNFKSTSDLNINTEFRGKGIDYIKSVISPKYGYIEVEKTDDAFQIKLFIQKTHIVISKKSMELF